MAVSTDDPLFPSSANVPEMTVKAIVLAIILTVILSAANTFLALKVGLTIAASIPAAVISMGILHLFKRSNALENNLVQTAASGGSALAAGIVFSLPALIIFHYWMGFNYWLTMIVGLLGGLMGVLFTVPVRKVLLNEPSLRFPEGTAIGNILRVNAEKSVGLKDLLGGAAWGSAITLFQTGFKFLGEAAQVWWVRGHVAFGLGCGFSPALLGAGFIIGPGVAGTMLMGVILGWVIGVPVLSLIYGLPADITHPSQIALSLWQLHIRYIGVGAMMVGGIYAIIGLLRPIYYGIKTSLASMSKLKEGGLSAIPRIERDIPIKTVFYLILALAVPTYFLLAHFGMASELPLSLSTARTMVFLCLIFAIIAGFFFSTVCAYFAGLIGSSSSPISSMALMSLILSSLLIMLWLNSHLDLDPHSVKTIAAAALAIIITAVICSAASISNDIMQDLKAGHMVGATPWKQQVMMMIGVVVSALVLPLILDLLFNAYGIGGVLPRPGMDPGQMLLAPQAGLMAAVVGGLFTHQFNATMLGLGMGLAILALLLNPFLQKKGFRIAILPLGIGIYLPLSTTMPMVIGGFLSLYIKRLLAKRLSNESGAVRMEKEHAAGQTGLLICCGLVAGASIMAVILAIPFGIKGSADALRLMPLQYEHLSEWISLVVTVALIVWLKKRVFKSIA